MTERAIRFGTHTGLVGIHTAPERQGPGVRRAVLLSNIGMHHRVGPFRIYVELGRALAASGFDVLRFDMSGMGDSEQRHDVTSPADRAAADLSDAMHWCTETLGITEFILVGLCSGVDSMHRTATQDARVRGAVFIDGYSYPTTGYRLRRYLLRPLQPGRWVRFLERRRHGRPVVDDGTAVFVREYPTRAQFSRDLAQMTQRGTRLLFVYSGGIDYRMNSPRQLFEMIDGPVVRDHLAVRVLASSDHVFTSVARRRELVDEIMAWVASVPR